MTQLIKDHVIQHLDAASKDDPGMDDGDIDILLDDPLDVAIDLVCWGQGFPHGTSAHSLVEYIRDWQVANMPK